MVLNVSCETDFVSKNADYIAFAQSIMEAALANDVKNVEELNQVKIDGETIADKLHDQVAKIGEKISVSRFERVDAPFVAAYIHGSYRMGVLVGMNKESVEAGKDVAMQIAAMDPLAIDQSGISEEVVARERNIAIEQIKAEGKPAEMAEKIAVGKLNKYFKDNTLLAQAYVKDGNQSVGDFLKNLDADLKVIEFKRVALG